MNLLQQLQQRFYDALSSLVSDDADRATLAAMVKPTQDPKHGDYQANCAMPLSKRLGPNVKAPEVAREIISRLDLGEMLEPPQVAGPGFINLRLRSDWLARQVQATAKDERLGIESAASSRTYVIDYSSPNVAKPMHVGHLRSTIIGDALARLFRFLGHHVVTDNHLGDWGTQFGMLLYGYKHLLNKEAYAKDPVRELARLYLEVRNLDKTFSILSLGFHRLLNREAFQKEPIVELARVFLMAQKRVKEQDEDEEEGEVPNPIATAYRQETAKLHAGDPENVALWHKFMPSCLEEIQRVYDRLGVLKFDEVHGESFYNPMLPGVVKDVLEKGIAQKSEGAVAIFFEEGQPPALVQKRDGAFTYTTSDLATIQYRVKEWHPDAILYVVDFRQSLHFKNLFGAARRWGYDRVSLEHVSFGSVLGKDRRPIKTREGGGVSLENLLDEAVNRAELVFLRNRVEAAQRGEEVPELSPEEQRETFEAIGLGAVKYADLSQNRDSDYVFDWDKMLAMNGNTATYMQYAYVRNRGIFRKGNESEQPFRAAPPLPSLQRPEERALAVQLLRFNEALAAAAAEYKPNLITAYLWDLAKSYSGFFQNCPVLKAETPELRQSRLLLCDLTARVIQRGLDLLGIRTMERM
jgi:arginyl-tRNA synthetase